MLQTGIFSKTYAGSLEQVFQKMTAQGIFHTQFNLSSAGLPSLPDRIDEKEVEKIGQLAKDYQVSLDILSGTFNMIHPDEEIRKKGCAQFALQCEIAEMLHIPIISLCTGSKNRESQWKWHDDNLKQASWDDLMRSTETILKYAEAKQLILGVETEASNIINTPERARNYLDAVGSPFLKIIMDGANLFLPRQVPDMKQVLTEAFHILGKDIVLAHAKDFTFDGKAISFTAAGEGILDFPYYIQLLKKTGYTGSLIMHGLSESQAPKSRSYLEEVIANA